MLKATEEGEVMEAPRFIPPLHWICATPRGGKRDGRYERQRLPSFNPI